MPPLPSNCMKIGENSCIFVSKNLGLLKPANFFASWPNLECIDLAKIERSLPNYLSHCVISDLSRICAGSFAFSGEIERLFKCYAGDRDHQSVLRPSEVSEPFRFPLPKEIEEATACAAYQVANNIDSNLLICIKMPRYAFCDQYSLLFFQVLLMNSENIVYILSDSELLYDFSNLSPAIKSMPCEVLEILSNNELNLNDTTRTIEFDFWADDDDVNAAYFCTEIARSGYYSEASKLFEEVNFQKLDTDQRASLLQTIFVSFCCLADSEEALRVNELMVDMSKFSSGDKIRVQSIINACTIELRMKPKADHGLVNSLLEEGEKLALAMDSQYALAFIKNISALRYVKKKDLTAAARELNSAITAIESVNVDRRTTSDEYGTLLLNSANLCSMTGDVEGAVALMADAIRVEPRNVTFRHALGNFLGRLGRHEDAVTQLEAGIEEGFAPENLLLSLADQLEQVGRGDECLRILRRTTSIYDNCLVAWLDGSRLCWELGDETAAFEMAADGLCRNPLSAELGCVLGEIASSKGDHHVALAAFSYAAKIDPPNLAALIGRAAALFELDRLEESRCVLEAGLQDHPNDETILDNLRFLDKHKSSP